MENQRLFLYIALGVILFLIFQAWETDHAHARALAAAQPSVVSTVPAIPAASPTTPPVAPAPVPPTRAATATPAAPAAPTIDFATDVLKGVITLRGGDIVSLVLPRYRETDQSPAPYALLRHHHTPLFYTQSGLVGTPPLPDHLALYHATQGDYRLAPGAHRLTVTLTWTGSDGITVNKTLTFRRGSYLVDVSYQIINHSHQAVTAYPYGQFLRTPPPSPGHLHATPVFLGGLTYTQAHKYQKVSFEQMAKAPLDVTTPAGWVAMTQHYFVAAYIPSEPSTFTSAHLPNDQFLLGYRATKPITIAPGATGTADDRLYVGPKQPAMLAAAAPGLPLTVDYGLLTVLAEPIYWALSHLHDWVGNWGWSIVLLTVLIKVLFVPLSAASYRSMAKMRKLQPRIDLLRERHAEDRGKMQQAMVELYRAEKINPLGGCLPLVIQIPVFIALYWVLLESVDLRQAPFILWIHDLSAPDPYFVLPILMGITMLVQQFLNPTAGIDPLQRKLMLLMPLVFFVFFLFFPSGLVLYWVVSNLLSIVQQWYITRAVAASA